MLRHCAALPRVIGNQRRDKRDKIDARYENMYY
jgi:hypothetical protein